MSKESAGDGVPEGNQRDFSWTYFRFKEAAENLLKAERLSREMLQCGNMIKEEWVEIQARIKLSFAQ